MTEPPPYLTAAELSEYLASQGVTISEQGVRRWCRDRLIECVALPGGQWRISRDTAEAILRPVSAKT